MFNIKIKETSSDSSRKVRLKVNTGETKNTCMLISRHQSAGQYQNMEIDNRSFEYVAKLKLLRMILTDQSVLTKKLKTA
jgi:hypothetical protein